MYDFDKMKKATELFLQAIGIDLNNEHFKETPERCANMWRILLDTNGKQAEDYVKTFTNTAGHAAIMTTNIPFFTVCSHHLTYVFGKISISYIANEKVIGLSKLARIARHFSKKPQVQENLTFEIAHFLQNSELKPKGVCVIIDAIHLCENFRGVRAFGATTRTQCISGCYPIQQQQKFEQYVNTMKENVFKY